MNISVYSFCYNEEILLPFFIKHYSTITNRIVIYDNNSTDNSREIIEKSGAILREYHSDGIRDDIFTNLKNNCWKSQGDDWSIVVDMDEFIYHPNLKLLITNAERQDATILVPNGYEMVSTKLPNIKLGQIYMQNNLGIPSKAVSKPCIFKSSEVEINFTAGCHWCEPTGPALFSKNNLLKLLHYRNLSKKFCLARHKMRQEKQTEFNRANGYGTQYDRTLKQVEESFDEMIKKAKPVPLQKTKVLN